MACTDEELLSRIGAGDRQAMQALYERHGDRLFRFALVRLGDPEEARDVVQETMIGAWRSAGSYRQASSASTWLFGICRNKVVDAVMRREARQQAEPTGLLSSAPPKAASMVEFWEAFGRLDEAQQELILLVFHYGFSQQEVAEILGVPVGTAKSRTFTARRRLQALLTEGGAQ